MAKETKPIKAPQIEYSFNNKDIIVNLKGQEIIKYIEPKLSEQERSVLITLMKIKSQII